METNAYNATTAEHTTTATTEHSEGPGIGLDKEFPRTRDGLLLIGGAVSALLFSICNSVHPWSYNGGGFGASIGWAGFIVTGILAALYLFRVVPRVPGPFGAVMLGYLAVLVLLTLIGFILAAVNGHAFSAAVASAVFAVPMLLLHGAFGFFSFMKWRASGHAFHRGECGHSYSVSQQTYQGSEAYKQEPAPAYGNY